MSAAETDVAASFRKVDAADEFAFLVEDGNAIQAFLSHAPANPQVAIDVDAKPVRRSAIVGRQERSIVCQLRSVLRDVVGSQDTRRSSGFDNVQR